MHYVAEQFTPEEAAILRPYFTNLDGPVFALVNLPEVVKGALFARYSRSPKSLRRLFLDEFVGELDISGDQTIDATVGLRRAEELYDRVFFEYGDDSVAQLGGVHLACEQASNLLTKVLEWGGHATPRQLFTTGSYLDAHDELLLEWIADSQIAALVADNYAVEGLLGKDQDPSRHSFLPIHHLCLFKLGIPLGELWYLGELAAWLREHDRSRFLLTAPPLRLPGIVGSPLTPVATV